MEVAINDQNFWKSNSSTIESLKSQQIKLIFARNEAAKFFDKLMNLTIIGKSMGVAMNRPRFRKNDSSSIPALKS